MSTTTDSENEQEIEQHRHLFLSHSFPGLFRDEQMLPVEQHPETSWLTLEMSHSEWLEAIDIVLHFGPPLLRDANAEQKQFRETLSPATVRKWTRKSPIDRLIDYYRVEEYTDKGSLKHRLLRRHKRKNWNEERWLICVPQCEVFDAIRSCHVVVNHKKTVPTRDEVFSRYYNITEAQIHEFVNTCPICTKKRSITKKRISSNDRFYCTMDPRDGKYTMVIKNLSQSELDELKDIVNNFLDDHEQESNRGNEGECIHFSICHYNHGWRY